MFKSCLESNNATTQNINHHSMQPLCNITIVVLINPRKHNASTLCFAGTKLPKYYPLRGWLCIHKCGLMRVVYEKWYHLNVVFPPLFLQPIVYDFRLLIRTIVISQCRTNLNVALVNYFFLHTMQFRLNTLNMRVLTKTSLPCCVKKRLANTVRQLQ